MHRQVWKGIDSDNESYISTSDQGADDLDDDDDDDSDDGMAAEIEPILETETASDDDSEARKKARKAEKKAKEKAARKGIKHEIAELKEKLGVDNEMRTPLMGEALADFYSRTSDYWNDEAAKEIAAAAEGEALSRKELKREGFQLAQKRFEELKPILDRLNELETEKADNDDKKKEKKKDKTDRKKNRLK